MFIDNGCPDDGGAAVLRTGTTTCVDSLFEGNGSFVVGALIARGLFVDCDFIDNSSIYATGCISGNVTTSPTWCT